MHTCVCNDDINSWQVVKAHCMLTTVSIHMSSSCWLIKPSLIVTINFKLRLSALQSELSIRPKKYQPPGVQSWISLKLHNILLCNNMQLILFLFYCTIQYKYMFWILTRRHKLNYFSLWEGRVHTSGSWLWAACSTWAHNLYIQETCARVHFFTFQNV